PVYYTPKITIYSVPAPQSIVTGPDEPRLVSMTQQRIGVEVRSGGDYRIAVRWSPYWHASDGCLPEGAGGMVGPRTLQPRIVTIVFKVNADSALDELAGDQPRCSLTG